MNSARSAIATAVVAFALMNAVLRIGYWSAARERAQTALDMYDKIMDLPAMSGTPWLARAIFEKVQDDG